MEKNDYFNEKLKFDKEQFEYFKEKLIFDRQQAELMAWECSCTNAVKMGELLGFKDEERFYTLMDKLYAKLTKR